MNPETLDTIIIGGGPAGSTAAGLLAKAGQKVLVLERDTFPRFHVGESLIPFGNDVLNELGIWDKLISTGFMPKLGAEFTMGNSAGFQRFWFGQSLGTKYAQTFQVERSKFDELLLNHAQDLGATVVQRAKVGRVQIDHDGVAVTYEHEGESREVRSRWIIDASGRSSVLGRELGLAKSDLNMPKKIAVFSHFKNVFRNDGESAGHITIVRLENAWCWFIPLDAEKTSVGLVQMLDEFKAQSVTPEESFQNAMAHHKELRFRMKNAEVQDTFHTEADYTFRHHQCAGPRWLLSGDAAGFIDPIFSSGVMVALRSSRLAARAVLKAAAENRTLRPSEQKAHTRQVKKMTSVFLEMIQMFYDRDSFEVFMNPKPTIGLPRAVVNLVGGNTDLNWSLQWRVRLFYLLCWLQRHMDIVPRLSFEESSPSPKPTAV